MKKLCLFFLSAFLTAAPGLAQECRFKKAFASADIACQGANPQGECMYGRFSASTGYEATMNDYMNCLSWSLKKKYGQ